MKVYTILNKLSRKKIGDLSPLPVMSDKNQTYFEFYTKSDLSMETKQNLRKNKRSGNNVGISKDASSLRSRKKRADRSEG